MNHTIKNGFKSLFFYLSLIILVFSAGCENISSPYPSSSSSRCAWLGNCSGTAPEGAYDEAYNTIYRCSGGQWVQVVYCGSLTYSVYSCTSKGGCGSSTTECSYAFNICSGASYSTCPSTEPVCW